MPKAVLREGGRENRTGARSGSRSLYSIRFRFAYGIGVTWKQRLKNDVI